MEWLFSWEVTSVGISISIGIGLGVLAFDDFKLAKLFFLMAAFDAAGGIVMWGIKTDLPSWTRNAIIFLVLGSIGVLATQSLRYVNRKSEKNKQKTGNSHSKKDDNAESVPKVDAGFGDASNQVYKVLFANNLYDIQPVNPWNPGGPTGIFAFVAKDEPSLEAFVSDGKLYFNAKLFGGSGNQVSIAKNELVNDKSCWDRNYNNSALEVVNQNGIPMLQVIYTNSHRAEVYGVFQASDGAFLVATPSTSILNPGDIRKVKGYPLKKIFRYPSRKYPGEEVDD